MQIKNSTNISRNHRWCHVITTFVITFVLLAIDQPELNAQEPVDRNKLEAKLLYDIEQWLEDDSFFFEEESIKEIEASMHKTAKELKTLEAQLEAQIKYLERIEGFTFEQTKVTGIVKPATPTEDLK